jgi:hypothetical protein
MHWYFNGIHHGEPQLEISRKTKTIEMPPSMPKQGFRSVYIKRLARRVAARHAKVPRVMQSHKDVIVENRTPC